MLRHGRIRAQSSTEYMLLISVVAIAVVGAAYVFIPSFNAGVGQLGSEVSTILATSRIGGVGLGLGTRGASGTAAGNPAPGPPGNRGYQPSTAAPVFQQEAQLGAAPAVAP